MPFRNVTKRDLFHGIANRRSHEDRKQLKQPVRPLKSEVSSAPKLSDIVSLEDIVKFIVKED